MASAPKPGTPVPPAYPLCELRGVEIFDEGIHRGRPYTTQEVDELIRNFDRFGPNGLNLLKPVVVLGHEEDQSFLERSDLPAAGVVTRLYRNAAGKPVADFKDVPQPVAALVSAKAYRKCSIEHYDEARPFDAGNGKVYKDLILRRVALLGGEHPQVKTLADLPVPVFSYGDRRVEVFKTTGGACFAFAESTPVQPRDALAEQIKQALPNVDQAFLDGLSDEQITALALAVTGTPTADPGAAVAADAGATAYPDRATMIQELVAAGEDATALDAMTDDEIKAKYAALKGGTFQDQSMPTPTPPAPQPTPTPAPTPTPTPAPKPGVVSHAEREYQRRTAELDNLNRRAAERLKEARRQEAEAFCDQMVRQGRMSPADRDAFFLPDLLRADDVAVAHKFSENGRTETVTEYEALRRKIAARPVAVKMGERVRTDGTRQDAHAEVAKVERFCELYAEALGPDAKKMVALAKKKAAENPAWQASTLIPKGAAEVA